MMSRDLGEHLKRRGKFITFEGIDGSGKTTQLGMLAAHLARLRIPFVTTREPGGTAVGEQVRNLLLSSATAGLTAQAEVLLMFAARAQNLREVILPALEAGKVVLCDRFTDASVAYQGYGRGIPLRDIASLHRIACGRVQPDLTLVIDINPRTSIKRARHRNVASTVDESRFEEEGLAFQERARQGYHALARHYPRRVKLINGEKSMDRVHAAVVRAVDRNLHLPRPQKTSGPR